MKGIFLFLQAAVVYIITLFIAIIPHRIALRLGELLGLLIYKSLSSRRRIAIESLNKIDPELIDDKRSADEVIKDTFMHLGKLLVECSKVLHGFGKSIVKNIEIKGLEHYENALKKGNGVFIISGHCGNWELLPLTLSFKQRPLTYAVRAIDNPYINKIIEIYRTKFGNTILYKEGALKKIFAEIANNGTVMMLVDQSAIPSQGVKIEFMGRPAWAMKSPVVIARRTGGTVLPAFIRRQGRGHVIEIHPEIKMSDNDDPEKAVYEDAMSFAAHIEKYVKENTYQWYWIHNRWKEYKQSSTDPKTA
ncbi:MAG: lysophospholipid acyltransferase family protein [Nitrospirota bacterium]|nr:MAG: lysophospholipid acyltransferase family protein [Nitrospirota bacterium]